jgi:FixJ family two-component response regulator
METSKPTVHVIDDEESIRRSLRILLRSVDLAVETHHSALSFLEKWDPHAPGCIVLDVRMSGMSGLELQDQLIEMGTNVPIIFLTGHADVGLAVRAMRQGAFDFMEKPFTDQEILDSINRAIEFDRALRRTQARREAIHARLENLTPREREVMTLVLLGKANKMIAYELGISERTVEIHRARMMKKMQAASLANLVKIGIDAGLPVTAGVGVA